MTESQRCLSSLHKQLCDVCIVVIINEIDDIRIRGRSFFCWKNWYWLANMAHELSTHHWVTFSVKEDGHRKRILLRSNAIHEYWWWSSSWFDSKICYKCASMWYNHSYKAIHCGNKTSNHRYQNQNHLRPSCSRDLRAGSITTGVLHACLSLCSVRSWLAWIQSGCMLLTVPCDNLKYSYMADVATIEGTTQAASLANGINSVVNILLYVRVLILRENLVLQCRYFVLLTWLVRKAVIG